MGEAFIVRKGGGIKVEFETTPGNPLPLDFVTNSVVDFNGSFPSQAERIMVEKDFIYVAGYQSIGGANIQNVFKFNKNDLTVNTNSPDISSDIFSLDQDDDFVYAPSFRVVRKLHKSNLAIAVQGNIGTGFQEIHGTAVDNDFVYTVTGSGTPNLITKMHKGNFVVANQVTSSHRWRTMGIDNDFIYIGSQSSDRIEKLYKTNLAVAAAASVPSVYSLVVENNFIYTTGSAEVRKMHTGNLAFVASTALTSAVGVGITIQGNFVFSGDTSRTVNKYYKDNLVFIGNTPNFSNTVFAVGADDEFIYAAGRGTVKKYQNGTPDEFRIIYEGNSYLKE